MQALTGGRGADYAFEVIGLPETILQAYAMARRGGTAVIVGMPRMDATVTLPAPGSCSAARSGCWAASTAPRRSSATSTRFIGLAETGRLDLGAMVSRRI